MQIGKKKSKSIIAMCCVFVAVLILLGGTLAWTDFTQSKTNRFRGTADPDVTLHDEFDGVNKDVFVENTGTSNIYVRVRLDEYMEISGNSFDPSADVRDKTTWNPHAWPQTGDYTDCNCIDDGNPAHKFHKYYGWEVTGKKREYRRGTPGLVYTKLKDDGTGKLVVDLDGDLMDDGITPYETAAEQKPITMATYLRLKGLAESQLAQDWGLAAAMTDPADRAIWAALNATGCWILDEDGWAYWSKVLTPDTATNLLLDKVNNVSEPEADWYYGIDVKLQAVTADDFGKWEVAPASNAQKLIDSWLAQ